MKDKKAYVLFGGAEGWNPEDWTSSDDTVRGGKSESHLECKEKVGRFYGTLDIKTLGGAGFASQRTTGDDRTWDLHKYVAIQIKIKKGDKKRYTLILKDDLLPPSEKDGREQATISYECDFELPPQAEPGDTSDRTVTIPFKSLNPTYRGRLKKDAKHIDLKKVCRISIMMRSFFGAQEGEFSLSMLSIAAVPKIPASVEKSESIDTSKLEKGSEHDGIEHTNGIHSNGLGDVTSKSIYRRRGFTILLLGLLTTMAVYRLSKWLAVHC